MIHKLDPFFKPQSIALFGSMQENWFFGAGVIIGDLLKWNYGGNIYPIHPTAQTVYGIKVYKDLAAVDAVPDLAVIVTSFKHVPGILHQCGIKGVKAAVIVSDGFGEAGPKGKIRQEELIRISKSYGIRVMGPNTVGVFNSENRFTTIPYDRAMTTAPRESFPSSPRRACTARRPWLGMNTKPGSIKSLIWETCAISMKRTAWNILRMTTARM